MRGVDLTRFDFDYDLTWVGFFMNANGKVYGRFGGRDSEEADAHLTLGGLKYAMRAALAAYAKEPTAASEPVAKPVAQPELYPAGMKLRADACIHCHNVYDFDRQALVSTGRWRKEMTFTYPPPANVGLTLDRDEQNRVAAVAPGTAAAAAGIAPGDVLRSVGGRAVASFADVGYALHLAPAAGTLPVTWERGGKVRSGTLALRPGWREYDISWRASMWGLAPTAAVYGKDLTAAEKQALGLPSGALAFRQGDFVPTPAARAGIKAKDIVLGLADRPMEMDMLHFNAYVRLNFNVGDRVTYRVIRDGKRLEIPMTLESRDF
jgi:serine protease Do